MYTLDVAPSLLVWLMGHKNCLEDSIHNRFSPAVVRFWCQENITTFATADVPDYELEETLKEDQVQALPALPQVQAMLDAGQPVGQPAA
ncbi:hypothetical protein ACROYT_G014786 [Oculina patagonica]